MRILACDIGATNARCALMDEKLHIHAKKEFLSNDFTSFDELLDHLHDWLPVDRTCVAAPGPIENGVCAMPNLPWIIEEKRLKKKAGNAVLINDFVAQAHAVPLLQKKDVHVLKKGKHRGAIAVIGAGTGLGASFITEDGSVHSSEAGHMNFAPQNKIECELDEFLEKTFDHVSAERVISGQGIISIYEFLCGKHDVAHPKTITDRAKKGDLVCNETLQIFAKAYGSFAGDFALAVNAKHIFITGGIAPAIFPKFTKEFLDGFIDKGRMSVRLNLVGIKVVTNPNAGLIGAARRAAQ